MLFAVACILAPLAATATPAAAADLSRSEAPHFVIEGSHSGAAVDLLPLKATHADVRVAGVIAHVTVQQVWENQGSETIEANYVFPASTRAAVFGMRMRIGDRVLRAKIEERDAARKVYEAAKQEGRTASLLEQERANVFSMHVANILPGDRIEVELDYTELLTPRDKEYELVFPQVVGPRYAKGASAEERWVANPLLASGAQAPFQFGIDVNIAAGVPVRDVYSPSHAIDPRFRADDELDVAVAGTGGADGGARDFVLRWRLVGDDVEAGVLLYRDKERGENFFLLLAQPPERVSETAMPPRELVFVVDVSGSMSGFPEQTSRALMERLLATLRPEDTFNVLYFASGSALLSERSVPATRANIDRAIAGHLKQNAGGGTNLDEALERALKLPTSNDVSRSFVLLTDGYVGFENQVFDLVRDNVGRANVYAFGIGSSVNRLLIEGVAKAGLGEPFVALDADSAAREAARFEKAISRPALTNVRVFYEGFDAYDVEPSVPTDLLEDRPLVLYGKFRGASAGSVRITGTAGGERFERRIPVEDHLEKPAHEALRYLWARGRIAHLADVGTPSEADIAEVTRLGLKYRLLTNWTSFVAVDYELRNPTGAARTVDQPRPLPDGVSGGALARSPFSRTTIIDFADATVEGELTKPDGMYMMNRIRSKKQGAIIQAPSSFSHKMAAGDLGGIGALGSGGSSGGVAYGFSVGSGGLGVRGTGAGGGGAAAGKASSSSQDSVVQTSKPLVYGSLDKNLITRVIKEHNRELRYCYERELVRNPKIAGKVVVKFVITGTGSVRQASIVETQLRSTPVETCVMSRIKGFRFPKPAGGGIVIVTYPFVFKPGK